MEQLAEARELARRFDTQPNSFSKEEWARVVPEWIGEHVDVTIPWLMSLQREPLVWIRTQPGKAGELIGEWAAACPVCRAALAPFVPPRRVAPPPLPALPVAPPPRATPWAVIVALTVVGALVILLAISALVLR